MHRNYRLKRELQTYNYRYKEIEDHVKQLIKDSVKRFEQKLGENIKTDSKSFYKYEEEEIYSPRHRSEEVEAILN